MLAVLVALASAIGYGASDYAAGLASREASVIRVTIVSELTSVLVMLAVVPWVSAQAPSLASVAWAAAAGLGGMTGAMALYLGFRQAAFSVAAPVSAVATAGFSVLAGLLFGEHPSGLALAGIALALPAILGVSASPAQRKTEPGGGSGADGDAGAGGAGRRLGGVLPGLAAGAGFAVLFIGLNRAGSGRDLWPAVISQVIGLAGACLIGAVTRQLRRPARRTAGLGALTGLTGAAGTLCYFVATHAGLLAVTAVITSLYPASTILLARLLLGERLTTIRLVGLCLAGASVALIAVAGAG
jgi:drug/metabolite transporter (DMT)-like permease